MANIQCKLRWHNSIPKRKLHHIKTLFALRQAGRPLLPRRGVGRQDARDAEGDFARFSGLSRFSFVFWGSSASKLWGSVTFRAGSRQAVSEGPASQLRRPSHQVASGGRAGLLRQASVSRGGARFVSRDTTRVSSVVLWC